MPNSTHTLDEESMYRIDDKPSAMMMRAICDVFNLFIYLIHYLFLGSHDIH